MYKLSNLAVDDFSGIYDYTLQQFGVVQADNYTEALDMFFEKLAQFPYRGRRYPKIEAVWRIEFQHHSVFYRIYDSYILVLRILHQQMDIARHVVLS